MATTLTILSAVNLPDATGGPVGEGFTCTGICPSSDGNWWIAHFGKETAADPTTQSGIIKISADFTTNLGEISLAAFGSASVQGVALDTTDNTIWVCINGGSIRHYSEAGTLLGQTVSDSGVYGMNGVAYDAVNDILYTLDDDGDFASYSPNSLALISGLTEFPGANPDQLTMSPNGKVWASAGGNGETGQIWEYDPVATTWTHIYDLTGADAVEGIVVAGDYIHVANDAYFHAGTPPENRVLTFQFQDTSSSELTVTNLNATNLIIG
jgi:streptogramin lyase